MSTFSLILKELWHRKWNALLAALGLAVTAACFIAYRTLAAADERETRLVTRDIGFNLRIIPANTDMNQFYRDGFAGQTMSESTLDRFVEQHNKLVSFNHLVGSLRQRFDLDGREVILNGISKTFVAPGQGKKPMGYAIPAGSIDLGFEVARRLGKGKGDTVKIDGEEFTVARNPIETGTREDITVHGRLEDVQKILDLAGHINEIEAIDCLCLTADEDPLSILRTELAKVLPEVRVVQKRAIADARAKLRQTRERMFEVVMPLLLVACAAWVAVLAVLNVRERRQEIGILRALGKGTGKIAVIFLGKATVIGVTGAGIGCAAGMALAFQFGPDIFRVNNKAIQADWYLLWFLLVATPLFTAVASFIPAMLAVTQDPAQTLREE